MMKYYIFKLLLIIGCAFVSTFTTAQERYLDDLFEAEKVDSSIVYAKVQALDFPYISEKKTHNKDLLMDIYRPKGDIKTNRPCILIMHGGAYLIGSRTEKNIVNFAENMAKKGYVTASIDYRIGFNTLSGKAATRAVYRSAQDVHAAIRYLKAHHQSFGIDTTHIFAFGASAGSIAILHASFLEEDERSCIPAAIEDLGCVKCSGNQLQHNGKPFAIANLWGAIIDTNIIDTRLNIPVISFHGTTDNVVSPDSVSPFKSPFFPALCGTNMITPRLQHLGIMTEYYQFNKGHAPWGFIQTSPVYDTIVDKTTLFFYNCLMNDNFSSKEYSYKGLNTDFDIYPNPTTDFINIDLINYDKALTIQIINNLGNISMEIDISKEALKETITLNIKGLSNGYYYLSIKENETWKSQLFYKKS